MIAGISYRSARFSCYEGPFVIHRAYCENLDCPKRDISLHFLEANEELKPLQEGIRFTVKIDLDTGKELDPPERSGLVGKMVCEFLEELPEELLTALGGELDWQRKVRRRLETYQMDVEDIRNGTLVAYSDILREGGSIARGGRGYGFSFEYGGREFAVEDMYCPRPQCRCQDIYLSFFEVLRDSPSSVSLEPLFFGSVSSRGKAAVKALATAKGPEALELIRAFFAARPRVLEELKESRRNVKMIAKRSLQHPDAPPSRPTPRLPGEDALAPAGDAPAALPPAALSASSPAAPRNEGAVSSPAGLAGRALASPAGNTGGQPPMRKVGRNEPCPCGSGKKFKKCCGS